MVRHRLHRLLLLALALGVLPAAVRAELSSAERELAAYIEAAHEQSLVLLERAVNINSGTFNFAGVRATGELFRAEFEQLGFAVRWIDGAPFARAGHLLAERGTRGPRVLLIGHLDTVFEPDSPFQKFEQVDRDIVRGPGTSDMKGGIVVALAALRALAAAEALDELHITVLLTGDEEDAGEPLALARAALFEAADAADIAIGLENADDDPATAVVARRGASSWTLTVEAKTGHSSQIFGDELGYGAVFELARILETMRAELAAEEFLTFNPGLVLGGAQLEFDAESISGRSAGKTNIIAPRAIALGDLRTISPQQLEQARGRMRAIVERSLAHATSSIEFHDGYPPLAPSEGNRALLARYDQASRDLGHGPVTAVDPKRAGAADISFTAGRVDMAIDGLGLLGGGNHAPGEFADLRILRVQAERLALLLYRLGRQ